MAKTFNEVFEEIKSNVSLSSKGKKLKNFSRTDFDRLAKAYINTPDYTIQKAVAKGDDSFEVVEIKPVLQFREMLHSILRGFGVDKQEADRVLTDEELVKNASCMYEFVAELIFQYMSADKKFDFITREDFSGSIKLKEVEEVVTTHRNPRGGDEVKVKKKAHRQLDKKSTAPKWLKSRV